MIMINLLPEHAKIIIRRQYHIRVAVVIMTFLFFLILSMDILLLPSFFVVRAKELVTQERLVLIKQQSTHADRESLDMIIKDINQKLILLSTVDNSFRFSEIVNQIIAKRSIGLTIKEFSAIRQADGARQISITGISYSREALQSFVKALGSDSRYTGVSLPVSNLAQGSDIAFTLSFKAINK